MGLNIFREYATDAATEVEGKWVALGRGARIKVARWNNDRHRASLEKHREQYKAFDLSGTPLPEDKAREIVVKAAAETILTGWEGLEDDDGQPIPYSPAKAEELLGLKDFRELVVAHSTTLDGYRAHEVEAAAKN